MTLFGLVYGLALHLYAGLMLPKLLLQPKYEGTLLQRVGFGFPHIEKGKRKLVWIHAVSFGETKAVLPLIKRLKEIENPPLILLTTTTKTGFDVGIGEADFQSYLPFDFPYVIGPIVKRLQPDLVVLTETDFWRNFQLAAKKAGADLIVINGKISERSFKRLAQFPLVARNLLDSIDLFCLQGEGYRKRFSQLGIPDSNITVTGNLKIDSDLEKCDVGALKERLGLSECTVLTLGSTHNPEERIWLQALQKIWHRFPQLKVLIVPRHPERFEEVAALLANEGIPFSRWSQEENLKDCNILLVDVMGALRQCYQISDIAFVGGSFTQNVGGHNILEPSFYGKPVLFGPYMHSQPDFLSLIQSFEAGIQISETTLLSTLEKLLSDPGFSHAIGENGLKLVTASRGALDKTFNSILRLLQKSSSC